MERTLKGPAGRTLPGALRAAGLVAIVQLAHSLIGVAVGDYSLRAMLFSELPGALISALAAFGAVYMDRATDGRSRVATGLLMFVAGALLWCGPATTDMLSMAFGWAEMWGQFPWAGWVFLAGMLLNGAGYALVGPVLRGGRGWLLLAALALEAALYPVRRAAYALEVGALIRAGALLALYFFGRGGRADTCPSAPSAPRRSTAAWLALLLGVPGAHRLYLGHIARGTAMMGGFLLYATAAAFRWWYLWSPWAVISLRPATWMVPREWWAAATLIALAVWAWSLADFVRILTGSLGPEREWRSRA